MQFFELMRRHIVITLIAVFMLAGCKETLYSELTEADANEMISLLVLSGVPASREKEAAGGFSVLIEEADLAVAVTVLRNSGLPRERFESFGDVFGDVGVVGTPFEERVRFAFATNQELSNTISQIKGVNNARVHVVIPAEQRFGKTTDIARASIAIFHDRSFEPSEYSARVKALVSYAVPGLEIENISLTFFVSPGFVVEPGVTPTNAVAGSAMASMVIDRALPRGDWTPTVLDAALFLILLIFLRTLVLFWRRFLKPSKSDHQDA